MPRRKLLVIAGAGASIEFGMPSVEQVDQILRERALELYPLSEDRSKSLYSWLVEGVTTFWTAVRPSTPERRPNFEDALYLIYNMPSVYPRYLHTSAIAALVDAKAIPNVCLANRREQSVDAHTWNNLGSYLADGIIEAFREKCREDLDLADYKSFFKVLSTEFEIAIVTLNYDDIIYRATSDLITGFQGDGTFSERGLFNRHAWECLLHLHGSVHFDMRTSSSDLHCIHWQEDLEEAFNNNAFTRGGISTAEGLDFPASVIVAGYGKTLQLLRQPFRSYYSELDRLVAQSDSLLILGYGFRDQHVNACLGTFRDDRTRPIVVVDHASNNDLRAADAEPNGKTMRLLKLVKTNPLSMRDSASPVPQNVQELKEQFRFDVSTDRQTPLAIWYNGMLQACRNPNKVLENLMN